RRAVAGAWQSSGGRLRTQAAASRSDTRVNSPDGDSQAASRRPATSTGAFGRRTTGLSERAAMPAAYRGKCVSGHLRVPGRRTLHGVSLPNPRRTGKVIDQCDAGQPSHDRVAAAFSCCLDSDEYSAFHRPPPALLRAVSSAGTPGDDDLNAMIAFGGFAVFFVLLGVSNWLFIRRRGPNPTAWVIMTTVGAVIGAVSVGLIAVVGPDPVSHWYSTTGRAFIDRSWSADEVKEVNDDTVAAFAGLAFG